MFVDISQYCKEQDIKACAIKLELTALNICESQSTEHHVAILIQFLNGLDSNSKSLYKDELKLIIYGDINISPPEYKTNLTWL
jgi:exonuclease III